MKSHWILLWVVVLSLAVQSGQASITNDTQATGPFPDIDQAMASAQDGDHFTVSGSTGGGNITINDCRITGAVGPGTDIIGESVVSGASVTLEDLTFDAAGANTNVLLISGKADVTANNCEFLNAGTAPAEVNGVEVGDGIDPAALIADGCLFGGATFYGLNLQSPGSTVTLTQCNAENNGNDAIHMSGDGSVLKMTGCFVGNNLDVGVKSGANGTFMEIVDCDFDANVSRHVETDNPYIGQKVILENCRLSGGSDRAIRFKGDDGDYLFQNSILDVNGARAGIRLGDSADSTLTVRNSCFFNIQREIIQVDGDPSGVTGIGGNNTVNVENSTFISGRSFVNDVPVTNPNIWNIQYCIGAEWQTGNTLLNNGDPASTFTENNNVFANTDGAASIRNNVAAGANTVDQLGATALTDLFCSTNSLDADFLKVLTTSAALNIDGVGGLAGGKTLCPATNPVVRGSDGAEFADLDAAVADAGTSSPNSLYVTASAGGGLVNKNDISIVGPGPIDSLGGVTTGSLVDVQADGVTISSLTIDAAATSGTGSNVSVSSGLTMQDVTVLNAEGNGVQVGGTGSLLNMTRCEISNSANNNLNVGGDAAVITLNDCLLELSGGENSRVEGSTHTVVATNSTFTESGNEGFRSGAEGSSFSFDNCVLSNAGGSGVPLGNRDHGLRVRGTNASLTVTNCLLTGNDSGIRFDSNSGQTGIITDTVIFFNGRATRVDDDHGGSGNFTYTNCTIHQNEYGLQTENLAGPNTWDVQYCIISDWNESGAETRYGFEDINNNENITDDNNVYADSDVANSARSNVTAGPNTVDQSQVGNIYCSVYPTNPLFLHVGTNSVANNIDGSGGIAGAKPASCSVTFISDMTADNPNWKLYE